VSTRRGGRPSSRLPRRSAARARRPVAGCGRRSGLWASGRVPRRQSESGSRSSSGRAGSSAEPVRSCRKLLPCSPRRGRGVRNAELGLVVQSPPPPGADRLYSAGRVRGGILARERGQATTRATQVTRPPINPLRFKLVGQAGRRDIAPYAVSDPAIL